VGWRCGARQEPRRGSCYFKKTGERFAWVSSVPSKLSGPCCICPQLTKYTPLRRKMAAAVVAVAAAPAAASAASSMATSAACCCATSCASKLCCGSSGPSAKCCGINSSNVLYFIMWLSSTFAAFLLCVTPGIQNEFCTIFFLLVPIPH
jgi:hypothetical protein